MRLIRQIVKFEAKLWIALFAVAGAIALGSSLFSSSATKTFTMPNESMVPTIAKNERVEVNMKAYETEDPQTGDLAIFIPNENNDLRWIFRVAAVPGDTVSYSNETLERNGKPIFAPEPLNEILFKSPQRMKKGSEIRFSHTLEETEYFFLSDDPSHMHDSRYWGIIERDQILGKLTSHK